METEADTESRRIKKTRRETAQRKGEHLQEEVAWTECNEAAIISRMWGSTLGVRNPAEINAVVGLP